MYEAPTTDGQERVTESQPRNCIGVGAERESGGMKGNKQGTGKKDKKIWR